MNRLLVPFAEFNIDHFLTAKEELEAKTIKTNDWSASIWFDFSIEPETTVFEEQVGDWE